MHIKESGTNTYTHTYIYMQLLVAFNPCLYRQHWTSDIVMKRIIKFDENVSPISHYSSALEQTTTHSGWQELKLDLKPLSLGFWQ